MPTGTYLGHEHKGLVSKSDVMEGLGDAGPSPSTQGLSTRRSSFPPRMILRMKGMGPFYRL